MPPGNTNMSEIGYIYLPNVCKDSAFCETVIYLHGCGQGQALWRETDHRRTGLLEWAGPNNKIVVFPMSDYPGDPHIGQYCWNSMKTTDMNHP